MERVRKGCPVPLLLRGTEVDNNYIQFDGLKNIDTEILSGGASASVHRFIKLEFTQEKKHLVPFQFKL